jgi:thiamine-phosphate pyrophosphorylase
VDVDLCGARGREPAAVADACFRGGARLLQLRQKRGSDAEFLATSERIAVSARACGARLIINDRADIARLCGAAGVHVGQDDLSVEDVRGIVGPESMVGLSTHTPVQIDAALETGADYVAVGPVFGTSTKDTGYAARGLEMVRLAAGRGRPIVAIGGITLASAASVIDAGAAAVCVISDLLAREDPEACVREYVRVLSGRGRM